jgi:hypothetical protein
MVWGKPRSNHWSFRVQENGETIAEGYAVKIAVAMEAAEQAPVPLPGSFFDFSEDRWGGAARA